MTGRRVDVAEAARLLAAGGIVAIPTETVYGLAGDARQGAAVAAIYAAKARPAFNPLIVHVAGLAEAEALADLPAAARALAERFWPGPLTIVVEARADCPVAALARAGLATIALRVPAHPVAQALLRALGGPIVAPSANPCGRLSPTTAAHVEAGLPGVPLLDGGACVHGLESTILSVGAGGASLLRAGAIPADALGIALVPASPTVVAPGQSASHYAPSQPVRLDATTAAAHEYHLGFGAVAGDATLSADGDLVEAAARLFGLLHCAQASGRAAIAVAPIPARGLGVAINDRLRRAAAPRSPSPQIPAYHS